MTTTQTSVPPRLMALADMKNDPAFEEISRISQDPSVSADDIGNFLHALDGSAWDTSDKRGTPGDTLIDVMWKKRPEGVSKFAHAQTIFKAGFACAECLGSYPSGVVNEVPELGNILDELTAVEAVGIGLTILEIGKSATGEEERKKSVQHAAMGMADEVALCSKALSEHSKAGPLAQVLNEWIHGWGSNDVEFEKYCTVYSLLRDIAGKE